MMIVNILKRQALLAGFVFFSFGMMAQSQNYYQSGTYFFSTSPDVRLNAIMHSPGTDTNIRTFFYIYGINAACVTFEFPYHGLYETRFLAQDSAWVITFPFPDQMGGDSAFQRGFWIYASAPVSVYQVMQSQHPTNRINTATVTEASVLAPMILHDTLVPFGVTSVSPNRQQVHHYTDLQGLRIASDADDNEIVIETGIPFGITNPGTGISAIFYPSDTTLTYKLDRGELRIFGLFHERFRQANHTKIYSANQKAFRIWTNTHYANCTNGSINSENFEDGKPSQYAGSSFHVGPLVEQPCRLISLMAMANETDVFIDGVLVRRLNRQDRMDTCISGAVVISSNKGLLGYEGKCNIHSGSIYGDGGNGWSVTLSSDEELIKDTYFSTITQPDTGVHYYVKVVAKTSHLNLLRINGVAISQALFDPFPTDPAWSYANIRLAPGFYRLQSDSGFHAIHFTHYPFSVTSGPASTPPIYGHNLAESVHWPADSFYFRVGYQPQNLVPFDSLAPSVCVGESVYFQPGHLRHRVWLYDFDDGHQLVQAGGNQLAPVVSHSWQTPGRYLVLITDTSGCYPPDSIWVEVRPGAQLEYEAVVSRSCEGNKVFLTYNGEPSAQIQWSWPGGSATTRQVSFDHDGSDTSLTVELVTSLAGCRDTIAFTLSITNPDFAPELLPNIITPNGDGVNDALCIPNARGYADCFKLEVFNRWGSRVYETHDPDQCWSPGNLPAGVYFYVIEIGSQSYKRSVTVVR